MANNNFKNRALRAFVALLAALMLLGAYPVAVNAVYYNKADYDDIKTEDLEEMRRQLEEYEKMLKEIKNNLNDAEALQTTAEEKRALWLEAEAIYNDQLKDLEKTQLYYETEIEKVGKEIAALQLEYDEAYEIFLDLLRMTYEPGSANYLEILLGAESFTDLLARIDRVSGLIRYSDTLMNSLADSKAELDAKYADLLAASEKQEAAIADLEAKKDEIAAWKLENDETIKEIEAEIALLVGEQGEYKSMSEMLDADFEAEVEAAIKAENDRRYQIAVEKEREEERKRQEALAEAIRRQSYLWPLPFAFDTLSYDYGYRTINELGYHDKFHYGIDIPAYRGTEIYASKAGKVLIAKYHTSYGYYVLLDHGDGHQTLYAHASALKVKAGQYVDQGAVLALVGSTGTSTGNHLHFEVRFNGKKVDPLDYVTMP